MPLDTDLHHTRAEIQGTSRLLGCIGAISKADAITKGLADMGNFLGMEVKAEANKQPRLKATNGVVRTVGNTAGMISFGYEFTTKEVADARKFRFALLGSESTPFTQAALAAVNGTAIVFGAGTPAPSKAGVWYPLLYNGTHVHALTTVTVAGKVEGVDFVLDKKMGLIRFLIEQVANVVPVLTGPLIDAAHKDYLIGIQPMTNVIYSGYWSVAAYDQDPTNNLVLRHEWFSGDLSITAWPKIDHENQSELKFQIDITRDNPPAFHRD
ncbi:MAG: hypothetical protein V4773_04255 [Verrucomicrobiota bacterium]